MLMDQKGISVVFGAPQAELSSGDRDVTRKHGTVMKKKLSDGVCHQCPNLELPTIYTASQNGAAVWTESKNISYNDPHVYDYTGTAIATGTLRPNVDNFVDFV